MNQSLVNIFGIISYFGSDEEEGSASLPARPSLRCETGHIQEGYVNIPLSPLFSGIFVCCNCVPVYAKGNS